MAQFESLRDKLVIPAGRWLKHAGNQLTVAEVASLHLTARLRTVAHWLPMAALRNQEDLEYVHQLRVATRRAVAALRCFKRLVPEPRYAWLRPALRDLRRAAGAARDLDVLLARLERVVSPRPEGVWDYLRDRLLQERGEAQSPIVVANANYPPTVFEEWVDAVQPRTFEREKPRRARQTFHKAAKRFLAPVAEAFLTACRGDLEKPEQLHALRVAGKKLRYTIEIVWPAYGPTLRADIYPCVETMQDFLGRINDHQQMIARWDAWTGTLPTPQTRRFVEGLLVAERLALADLREMFMTWWVETDFVSRWNQIQSG